MKHVLVTVTALGILGLRKQFDKVAPAHPPQSSVKPDLKQPLKVHR